MLDNKTTKEEARPDKDCSACRSQLCYKGRDCYPEVNQEILERYREGDSLKLARASACIEAAHYMKATRLEEIKYFAREMGYTRLGIAACIGLVSEAQAIAEYLKRDFEVFLIICKHGGIPKKQLSLPQISQDEGREEIMCNPIGQAEYLNQHQTELNIICGLCIGHDILFTQNSSAPVTTIIVKDRVLGHNPAAALYTSYYRKKVLKLDK